VITHDVSFARGIGGEIIVLKDGHCIERGQTHDILSHPSHEFTKSLLRAENPEQWPASEAVLGTQLVLSARHLIAGRHQVALTPELNFTLKAGERIALTGPSGTGKTTVLDTLAGLLPSLAGEIARGSTVGPTSIQKIYQDPPAAFPPRVTLGTSLKDVAKRHDVPWDAFENLLSKLKVDLALLDRLPDQVSGGELQRIAIVRALVLKPKILLADEPTSRLDPITEMETMALLAEVTRETETAVILVTHNRKIAKTWAHNTIELSKP